MTRRMENFDGTNDDFQMALMNPSTYASKQNPLLEHAKHAIEIAIDSSASVLGAPLQYGTYTFRAVIIFCLTFLGDV